MPEQSPIERTTVEDMTNGELDTLLAQRRERRLKSFQVYLEAEESRKRARDVQLRAKLEKQLALLLKEFDRTDAALDKLDKRILVIAGIRLELEDYV